ncbi:dipeptidyl peptidase 1-like [Liolophura sinensis]|uniref:dipeptidyl peptidase 1-like n=1 Tax=Liolophura sinensis TaxID=3198878 RepID=UPI0031594953
MAVSTVFLVILGVLQYVQLSTADTPANCTYEDIKGTWKFLIGPRGNDNTVDCSKPFTPVSTYDVILEFPDVAYDNQGQRGFWTLIYNQGFEVVINDKKFFAFSAYKNDSGKIIDYCEETFPGWVHDINEKNWACYNGVKQQATFTPKHHVPYTKPNQVFDSERKYKHNAKFIEAINVVQTSWVAGRYAGYEGMSLRDLHQRGGGRRSARAYPRPAPITKYQEEISGQLPDEFDWRDVNGVNYVSPVRNQQSCGSCYAFGSMAMLEARTRILTNNSRQPVFSTQDAVSCSEYAQACEGGFPYLIAGKYGEDFGVIEESCFPYTGKESPCKKTKCRRHYTTDYYYIGGYYGACNEPLMRMELVKNGPVAISFEVYSDFQSYKGGIYHHTGLQDHFNPWEITNHVVLVVGYGQDKASGEKFWTVKNSWGEKWGEKGYFRIRRGTDECSMESMAVAVTPVV